MNCRDGVMMGIHERNGGTGVGLVGCSARPNQKQRKTKTKQMSEIETTTTTTTTETEDVSTEIDREKITPFLLKVFVGLPGEHYLDTDFVEWNQVPEDFVTIYTWPDANIAELTQLIGGVFEEANAEDVQMDFKIASARRNGKMYWKPMGTEVDSEKTLGQAKFLPGDMLVVNIE
eukprot:TRINITY_DN172_c0_g1_i5.p1 TRINITY_DN172_c0_g1~~TRINITY_DN172_c0_g1_i5.p1  ORF type:complete len:175 (-),score=53.43 TRINITY_DN172_c0_g1_i5:62-586(-)